MAIYIQNVAGMNWIRIAGDGRAWKDLEEAYIQEWIRMKRTEHGTCLERKKNVYYFSPKISVNNKVVEQNCQLI